MNLPLGFGASDINHVFYTLIINSSDLEESDTGQTTIIGSQPLMDVDVVVELRTKSMQNYPYDLIRVEVQERTKERVAR